jgi:hypothetical protein
VSYDDPITCEYFNVHIRGDIELHNKVNHFMVTRPDFQRYQAVKTMLTEGTFQVQAISTCAVFNTLERLCEEKEALWFRIHREMLAYAEGLGHEA